MSEPAAPASGHPKAEPGRTPAGKLAVLYDGECAMCRAAAEGMRRFDNAAAIELVDLHHPGARSRFPALEREKLLEELHVVDDAGRVFRGARALNELLRRQRGFRRYLAFLWYLPGYPWLAERQYKRLAASRYGRELRSDHAQGHRA